MQKFPLKKGLSSAQELHEEINNYIDVLMGHINPPIADGVDTLFEVSSTYPVSYTHLTLPTKRIV